MVVRRVILTLFACLSALAVGSAWGVVPALGARGHVWEKSFGSEGSAGGQFKSPKGVTVNEASGDVYVVDSGNNRVEWFSESGALEGQFDGSGTYEVKGSVETGPSPPSGALSGPNWIAIDNACKLHKPTLTASTTPTCAEYDPSNGDVYVVDVGHKAIDKFTASGAYVGQLTESTPGVLLNEVSGLTVDAEGELWIAYKGGGFFEQTVANFNDSTVNGLIANRSMWHSEGAYLEPGFALGPQHSLYLNLSGYGPEAFVIEFSEGGEPIDEEFEPLKARKDATALASDAISGDVYIDEISNVKVRTPQGALVESFGSGQLSKGAGVGVNAVGETVYVADETSDTIDVFAPEPPAKPTVEGESVSDVAGDSATFNAEINPRGPASEYRFEYGPCATIAVSSCAASGYAERAPVPDGALGSGWPVVSVSAHVQNLTAHTTYHFRVLARNELGEVMGSEQTFTTQSIGGELMLPDGRQWELVSPPDKHGAMILPLGSLYIEGLMQASAGGNAIAYLTSAPVEDEPQGYDNGVTVLSARGASGWSSRSITPPHEEATGLSIGKGAEYRFFSEDLSSAVVQPFGLTPLSPQTTEYTPYLHSDFTGNGGLCVTECFSPIVSSANVPAGTKISGGGLIEFEGASPDLRAVVVRSGSQLTATLAPKGGLYEWSSGQLQLVSILPGGGAAEGAYLGARFNTPARGAVSQDGSLVVWSAGGNVYLTDVVHGETVQIGSSGAVYLASSRDGSRVFYLEFGVLYEYDLNASEGSRATDLSVDLNAGEAAGVTQLLGVSQDGSYVYFAASGVLAPGAAPGQCGGNLSQADTLLCNVYVRHNGKTTFVVGLSQQDVPDWDQDLAHLTARVSPNGHWLAFQSLRSLTGYDTADALSGRPDEQVYLYNVETTKLVCASCNPTGARPAGAKYQQETLVGADRLWPESTWLSGAIPPWTRYELGVSLYQSRYLSDSGRLFFDSRDALVPQDVNGNWDVYEYEPPGVGSCTTGASAFSERTGGCVGLISSGGSAEESAFLDASATGGDVFFLTSGKLVPADYDHSGDVYDAHECAAADPCFAAPVATPPACSNGEACKAGQTPQPAVFGSPASATFSGAGNVSPFVLGGSRPRAKRGRLSDASRLARALRACRHAKGRTRRAVCRRRARRRYGMRASRRARRDGVLHGGRGAARWRSDLGKSRHVAPARRGR